MLAAMKRVSDKYGVEFFDASVVKLSPQDSAVMAYYSRLDSSLGVNKNYFNAAKMDAAYDRCVASGWHPGRGNYSGLEATAAHEAGHAITDAIGQRMTNDKVGGLDVAADSIMRMASERTGKSVATLRRGVSGYAKQSNSEAVAEAFADVYCNGSKASSSSRAIVSALDSHFFGEDVPQF